MSNLISFKNVIYFLQNQNIYIECNIFFTLNVIYFLQKGLENMIIARSEWFARRKYGGWGVSIKTWQGAVYFAGMFALLIALQLIPNLQTEFRSIITGIWVAFLLLDMADVMWNLKKDERERIHEAIAERNAAWGMMLVLVIGIFIELTYYALQQQIYVDPFLITALIVGVIIKSVTNYKLERED